MTVTVLSAFTASQVCALAGVTYRQLDYWTRTGRVSASRHPSRLGSGDRRLYGPDDVLRVTVLGRLLDAGLTLSAADRCIDTVLDAGVEHVRLSSHIALTVDVDALRHTIDRGRRVAS